MFGIKRGKGMLRDEIVNFISDLSSAQLDKDRGHRDYSSIKNLGRVNAESEVAIEMQTLIISGTVYNAIKDALCVNDITSIKVSIVDLETIPLYNRIQQESLIKYIERFEKARNIFVLENGNLKKQLDMLKEGVWDLWHKTKEVGDSWGDLIEKMDFGQGDSLSNDIDEILDELYQAVFKQFSMNKLLDTKKMLLSFAITYADMYIENPVEAPDGRMLDNQYDLFYEVPYKLLFEKKGIISLEVLMSKIIIFVQNGIDKGVINDLNIYIAQNVNSLEGKRRIGIIEELLSLYQGATVSELKKIVDRCTK